MIVGDPLFEAMLSDCVADDTDWGARRDVLCELCDVIAGIVMLTWAVATDAGDTGVCCAGSVLTGVLGEGTEPPPPPHAASGIVRLSATIKRRMLITR